MFAVVSAKREWAAHTHTSTYRTSSSLSGQPKCKTCSLRFDVLGAHTNCHSYLVSHCYLFVCCCCCCCRFFISLNCETNRLPALKRQIYFISVTFNTYVLLESQSLRIYNERTQEKKRTINCQLKNTTYGGQSVLVFDERWYERTTWCLNLKSNSWSTLCVPSNRSFAFRALQQYIKYLNRRQTNLLKCCGSNEL